MSFFWCATHTKKNDLFWIGKAYPEEKRISTFFGFGPVKFKPKNMRREKKDSMDCFFLFKKKIISTKSITNNMEI